MEFKGIRHSSFLASGRAGKTKTEKRTSHTKLLESIILARATLLARKGKLKQAEVLLLPLVKKSESRIDILDLLAKVYAQQGKMEEAQGLWLQVLRKEPSNKHVLRALLQLCKASPKVTE